MKSRNQYKAMQHYHAGWDRPLEHAKALVYHLFEQYSIVEAFEYHAIHVEKIKSHYISEPQIHQELIELEARIKSAIQACEEHNQSQLFESRNAFLLKINYVLMQKYSEDFFARNAYEKFDAVWVVRHFATKVLMSDFMLNLEMEEKRFAIDVLVHKEKSHSSQAAIDQRNLFSTQYETRMTMLEGIVNKAHLVGGSAGLMDDFLSQQIEGLWNCAAEVFKGEKDFESNSKILSEFFEEYKLTINKKYPRSSSQNKTSKSFELVDANIHREWLAWLETQCNKKDSKVFFPVRLVQEEWHDQSFEHNAYLGSLHHFAVNLLEVQCEEDLQRAANKARLQQAQAYPVGQQLLAKDDFDYKTYFYVMAGVSIAMLGLIACVATGGMALMVPALVHLIHIPFVVAKLSIVCTAMLAGGGLGLGAKKSDDVVSRASVEMSDRAVPRVYVRPTNRAGLTQHVVEKAVSLNDAPSLKINSSIR